MSPSPSPSPSPSAVPVDSPTSVSPVIPPVIRRATAADAAAIADIHNQGIAERSATFDTEPRIAADVAAKLAAQGRHPVLVAVDADDRVLGWAGLGDYRPRACYAGIGEFSVYLDRDARGRGLGRALLAALVDAARGLGYWKLVSRVFTFNAASLAMCRACGFREVGVYEKHGQLDGRWLDVVIVERLIDDRMIDGRPIEDARAEVAA